MLIFMTEMERIEMNEYINLTAENIESEHICCAIGDPKHQAGVDRKKEWIKSKLSDGHVFRKLNARGKTFIEYEPIETAWVPISGKNYEYIYCLWVAGSFKGKGIGGELLEYAIADSKEKGMSGICTLVSKKKKPFLGEKKFFEHYGFAVVDEIGEYQLLALRFDDGEAPKFNDNARNMKIDSEDFTVYYSPECPYVEYEVGELSEYAEKNGIAINFIKIDTLEKAKNAPCVFNNWANFYKGEFVSNTILNANSFKKLIG
ncbi:MAG: GNAT family N-acetyltransferase [Oscillospiraceae bacterium]